eukprot:3889904-Rhodomonas_salina.1
MPSPQNSSVHVASQKYASECAGHHRHPSPFAPLLPVTSHQPFRHDESPCQNMAAVQPLPFLPNCCRASTLSPS